MFKRLLLVEMLIAMLSLPVFANETGGASSSAIVDESDTGSESAVIPGLITADSDPKCVKDTLGTAENGAEVIFKAIYRAKKYSCGAGYYLKGSTAACVQCLTGYYCDGVTNVDFTGEDLGLNMCNTGFDYSDESATTAQQCFKITEVSCATKNPYTHGHGTAVYANANAQCKQYDGNTACDLIDANACNMVDLSCDPGYTKDTVDGELQCVRSAVHCDAGTYLPAGSEVPVACLENSYCAGGDWDIGQSADQGITKCEPGLKSPVGAKIPEDCGHVLHIGNDKLYLHSDQQTHPSLVVEIEGQKWYANMTPISEGAKTISSDEGSKTLHIQRNGTEYTVHGRYVE